ncbi:hypothetical protein A2630_00275 [Candidatus Woesebacteria bacterium RIFCSPHIGHO2_01_FULL_44_10]|uniref:AAA+ ATPase domain-containing protein n=1 Tax=Candidatus Woesebacteria bacterium RIFCSPLOWO2_01_FULL_44_14 TaxID=1802525 RepID=A0A1F8BYU6_9BACT|nr:MAG: hypothetical protein A2630_00275 [Candidatus Woesebacteria bacterium RIFCSPHIGHO2_01_FULL_44_10]OGM55799.1 MAG: hypothetical protein A3F62_04210 [Candidatus Woesebacteria bacterium RIFCSPHIGHO2_12_FULL_44_11]OGM68739.1 MAG: hypothetical protein A2975_05575 [Candidatus Woesebacteria bacterium RIFCSPLOWO2_01_FULL_44_14]
MRVNKFPARLKPRNILQKLIPFLKTEEILLLYGMRQTGKTSLMFLLMNYLLNKKVEQSQIVYLDLENIADFEALEKIRDFDNFINLLKVVHRVNIKKRTFIFIDEIQHLTNPSSFLKYLHDHYKPNLKFIVSGSSSLEIKKKFSDALTGRILRFEVLPLEYKEFLNFSDQKSSLTNFEEFILYGGFPAISLKSDSETKELLLKEIYSLYVRRDIKDIGAIEDILSFNRLAGILAAQIGSLVSEVNLSNAVDISRPTTKNYLFILQNTFVINLLTPFFTNPKKELTKTPKVYFNDTGLRNAALDNFTDLSKRVDKGSLAENAVFSELKKAGIEKINFWRTERKQEIDFILQIQGEIFPLEVKYQTFRNPRISSNLKTFIKKYQPAKAYIATKNFKTQTDFLATKVYFVPCYKLNYLLLKA